MLMVGAPVSGGSSTATLTIASGKTASNLTDYPVYVNLADMPVGFWPAVTSDGGNIRVKQSGSDIPFDVVKIDTVAKTGSLFFKAASLLTASSNIYTIETVAGGTMPAVGASNGRNAVWSAFDWVFLCNGAADITDRTGGADGNSGLGRADFPLSLGAGCGIDFTSSQVIFSSRPSRSVFTLAHTALIDVTSISASMGTLTYRVPTPSTTRVTQGFRDTTPDNWNTWDNVNSWITTTTGLTLSSSISKRVHTVYNGSTNRKYYADGAINTTSGAMTARSTDTQYAVGGNATDTSLASNPSNEPLNGKTAFCYARPQALSADYIAAEYSNVNAPASFYSIV